MRNLRPKKRKEDNRGRPINHWPVQINETGEVYVSYADAARAINGHKGDILLCLRGLRFSHKGYTFRYVNPECLE